MLRRLLGLPQTGPTPATAPGGGDVPRPAAAGDDAETQTVRRIVSELEAMPPDRARFLAGFAYVLARAADADLTISDEETREMERIVVEHGHLPESQAVLVVGIAKSSARLIGATEDYLVTREFVRMSTPEQRLDLLRCCYLVGSADGTINAEETGNAEPDRRRAPGRPRAADRASAPVRRQDVCRPGDAEPGVPAEPLRLRRPRRHRYRGATPKNRSAVRPVVLNQRCCAPAGMKQPSRRFNSSHSPVSTSCTAA